MSSSRYQVTPTSQPRSARATAMERPIPDSLPVTIARWGTKSRVSTAMPAPFPGARRACPPREDEASYVVSPPSLVLVIDIANVMGSRPDGWWRDRAGAATRLLAELEPLSGAEVTLPELGTARITEIRAVVEGAAKRVEGPEAVSVLRADGDGDSEIVEEANRLTAAGKIPLVVTADRG